MPYNLAIYEAAWRCGPFTRRVRGVDRCVRDGDFESWVSQMDDIENFWIQRMLHSRYIR